jgi:membrane-bound lytic murein transglycosylase D
MRSGFRPGTKVKVDALQQRMTVAEKRYSDALLLVANADPKGSSEADAALEDMEDVLNDCVKQGCQMGTLLAIQAPAQA